MSRWSGKKIIGMARELLECAQVILYAAVTVAVGEDKEGKFEESMLSRVRID